jgi:thiamine pyrophosphate-dependent acetolactate synthase large subunit-like protein
MPTRGCVPGLTNAVTARARAQRESAPVDEEEA